MNSSIIEARDLLSLLGSNTHVVLLDVRFAPGEPSRRDRYVAGHLPGAHYVDLPTELQSPADGVRGARPLPAIDTLRELVHLWGIHPNSTVVVYSDDTHSAAARAWFVLRWAGIPDVRFLNGGLSAWIDAGGDVATDEPAVGGGTVQIEKTGHLPVIDADDIWNRVKRGVPVLDARTPAAFAGDLNDQRSGHIPGTISAPSSALLGSDGRLLPKSELRDRFAALSIERDQHVALYCGGGVAASFAALALSELGYQPELFVGSFSAWAADPNRPVEQSVHH
ncbi:sulfurtransferase [Rhodococcus erythropolis]|uniref:sulfurtransferase n=1 Tax=Rhodococcus erythropolis TaxID=1833 RepID=UPI0037B25DB6